MIYSRSKRLKMACKGRKRKTAARLKKSISARGDRTGGRVKRHAPCGKSRAMQNAAGHAERRRLCKWLIMHGGGKENFFAKNCRQGNMWVMQGLKQAHVRNQMPAALKRAKAPPPQHAYTRQKEPIRRKIRTARAGRGMA